MRCCICFVTSLPTGNLGTLSAFSFMADSANVFFRSFAQVCPVPGFLVQGILVQLLFHGICLPWLRGSFRQLPLRILNRNSCADVKSEIPMEGPAIFTGKTLMHSTSRYVFFRILTVHNNKLIELLKRSRQSIPCFTFWQKVLSAPAATCIRPLLFCRMPHHGFPGDPGFPQSVVHGICIKAAT
jgi:hypothetical protein